jgi:hypothetical protein
VFLLPFFRIVDSSGYFLINEMLLFYFNEASLIAHIYNYIHFILFAYNKPMDTLCAQCHKFFGSPDKQFMCSVCFKYLKFNLDNIKNKITFHNKLKKSKSNHLNLQNKPTIVNVSNVTKK